MRTGKDILISAAEKELKRLTNAAQKKADEVEEYLSVGSRYISLSMEMRSIDFSDAKAGLKKLESLEFEGKRLQKISRKCLINLTERQCDLEFERDELAREISYLKMRLN